MEFKSSTRLQRERTRPFRRKLFGCASRTRREPSIRPNIRRIDVELTELERFEVWSGPPDQVVGFRAADRVREAREVLARVAGRADAPPPRRRRARRRRRRARRRRGPPEVLVRLADGALGEERRLAPRPRDPPAPALGPVQQPPRVPQEGHGVRRHEGEAPAVGDDALHRHERVDRRGSDGQPRADRRVVRLDVHRTAPRDRAGDAPEHHQRGTTADARRDERREWRSASARRRAGAEAVGTERRPESPSHGPRTTKGVSATLRAADTKRQARAAAPGPRARGRRRGSAGPTSPVRAMMGATNFKTGEINCSQA